MKNKVRKSTWTVLCRDKSFKGFDDREEMVKFIASNPKAVVEIRHYGRLTKNAIQIYQEGLSLVENNN